MKIDEYQTITIKHKGEFDTKDQCMKLVNKLKGKTVKLTNLEKRDRTIKKPSPINTTDMLVLASKRLGLEPSETSRIAQYLYTMGFISYPRTESRVYSEGMQEDFEEIIEKLQIFEEFEELCDTLLSQEEWGYDFKSSTSNEDHPPITPTYIRRDEVEISEQNFELYDLIVRSFFASLSTNATYTETKATFNILDEEFTYRCSKIVDEGFMEFLDLDESTKMMYNFVEVELSKEIDYTFYIQAQQVETAPPNYITEHELVRKMEENGIGTDGTIPKHIENVIFREYVSLERSKKDSLNVLKPTPLGVALAEGYRKIDPELIEPTVRQYIEQCNYKVATYQKFKDDVISRVISIAKQKLERFIELFDQEIVSRIKRFQKNPEEFAMPDIKQKQEEKLTEYDFDLETTREEYLYIIS